MKDTNDTGASVSTKTAPTKTSPLAIGGMISANKALFTFAIIFTVVALVGSLFHIQISQGGIQVKPTLADAPLLVAMLILFVGNFNFYSKIIEPQGELALSALLSLFGMIVMALLPAVVLIERLLPWRYIAVTVYFVLVVLKNVDLSHHFSRADTRLFRIWRRRAAVHALLAFGSGVLFFCLTTLSSRRWIFARIIECPNLSFKPVYQDAVNWIFDLLFLLVVLVLFLVHHKDLNDLHVP